MLNSKTKTLESAGVSMTITPDDHAPHNARACQEGHFTIIFFCKIPSGQLCIFIFKFIRVNFFDLVE